MLKIWQAKQKAQRDVEWLMDQVNTPIDYLAYVGIANEIIDEVKEAFNKLEIKEIDWTDIVVLKSEDLAEKRSE